MSVGGFMATILGVFLTVYALINNRTLKAESSNTREILREGFQSTKEILLRIEQGQEEARREMAEAIRYLAQLLVQEGARTREAIQAKPSP
jgi:hypothetical protein